MEDVKPLIIPTRFKARISHELSLPIGAEKISKALSDCPQIANLALHFNSDRWRTVRFGRYPLISIQHSSRRADMADRFLDSAGIPLFSEWQLDVFPVPRIHRYQIQQYIQNQALLEINDWLLRRAELKQPGEESLKFFYEEAKTEFTPEIEARLQPQRT